jgi:co-chaperonin GroES (HSP10)
MKIKPCGFFVLVDVTPAEKVTSGGILLPDELTMKEQMAAETGKVIAIGPAAYIGMRGCTEDDMERTGLAAHKLWGVDVGDTVEFRKFEGKAVDKSAQPDMQFLRYIPDTHILGVICEA